jgi:hypothetical protein
MQFVIRHCFTLIEISSNCTLHTSISKECVRWSILEIMRTVPLHPNNVHSIHYIWVYQWNVSFDIF